MPPNRVVLSDTKQINQTFPSGCRHHNCNATCFGGTVAATQLLFWVSTSIRSATNVLSYQRITPSGDDPVSILKFDSIVCSVSSSVIPHASDRWRNTDSTSPGTAGRGPTFT